MNAPRFVMLILILALSLVCLHSPAGLYPEGAFDFDTLPTTTILDATHVIVGEITHVSFVFELRFTAPEYGPDGWATSGPLSIVTIRVDKDIKEAIDRAENPNKPKSENETNTVHFAQVGGPHPDGSITEVVGRRRLEKGDYVFLKLVPSDYPVTNKGITVYSCILEYGTTFDVEQKGKDNVDKHIITNVWNKLDVPVLDMTRIVRATLKKTEAMRLLDEKMNRLRNLGGDAQLQTIMDKVEEIEKELKLPELKPD